MNGTWIAVVPILLCALTVLCALSCRRVLLVRPVGRRSGGSARVLFRGQADGGASLGLAMAIGASAGLLTRSWPAVIGSGAACGIGLPTIRRRMHTQRDARQFRSVLPEFVEELARGLRGGLSPTQALIDGARAMAEPFPQAFRPAATLLAAGASANDAVGAWADKRNDNSIRFLATAMEVGNAVGGIDGRSVDAVAEALRERNTTEATVRVQATQALYSAAVLCGAPVVFCIVVVMSDRRSSAFLLANPLGRVVGATGIALDAIGALWMKRMVQQVVR